MIADRLRRLFLTGFLLALGCEHPALPPTPPSPAAPSLTAPADPTAGKTIEPEDLVRSLGGDAKARPLVLHVGPEAIFHRDHVPGARYVGMASTPEGLAALQKAVQGTPRDSPIVLYCGCCPWARCPNVRPALAELEKLGFTRVKVLDIPHNFQTDWAVKGLPVEK